MSLMQLIYTSEARGDLEFDDLRDILNSAKPFNKQHNITGALAFANRRFLQLIEGPPAAINRLYHDRICKDGRHEQLNLIAVNSITERHFERWAMTMVSIDKQHADLCFRLGIDEEFRFSMHNGDTCLALLQALMNAKAEQGIAV